MAYLGCILFGLVFMFLEPKTRAALTSGFSNWGERGPLSYVVLALMAVAPLIAYIVLKSAPKIEEPENPLAKYKNEILPED
jgi:hypothetical protein